MTATQQELIRALPRARRYARALTGSQTVGDRLVATGLREILDADGPADGPSAMLALFGAVSRHGARAAEATNGGDHGGMTVRHRQLLLLTTLEELPPGLAGRVLGLAPEEAERESDEARRMLREATRADVLIIEDEPIIAMDLSELVAACGHRVAGIAASESEAIAMAERTKPSLILADINLGHGGDGKAAVAEILKIGHVPVIFVTAYPERLLTGDAIEPAFVITKPFDPMTLAVTTYQAVTGGLRLV